ncbi:MAG: putative adhesin [Bacilli bacterium]|nr:putative adhesin [Bacilli bacterium]
MIQSAVKGDREAFRLLVARYQAKVLQLCFQTLRNRADAAEAQNRAALLDVQITNGKQTSIVVVNHGSGIGWALGSPAVDLVLQVPGKLKTQVQSTVGSIELSNLAEVDVESNTGAVTVRHIAGNAAVHTTTGQMDVEDVQGTATLSATTGVVQAVQIGDNLDVKTTTGHVSFRDAAKDVHVDATTGTVDGNLTGPIGGNYDLGCTTGAILLTVPGNSSASFTAQSHFGSISGSLPWSLQQESGVRHGSASIGSGEYQVNLHTATGHIEVDTR